MAVIGTIAVIGIIGAIIGTTRIGNQLEENMVNNSFNANINNKVIQRCKISNDATINNIDVFVENSTINGQIILGAREVYKGSGCLLNSYINNAVSSLNDTSVNQAASIKTPPFQFGLRIGNQEEKSITNNKTNYTIKSLSYSKCDISNTATISNVFLNIDNSVINGSVNLYSSVQSSGSCKLSNSIKTVASSSNITKVTQSETNAGWWSTLINGIVAILGKIIIPVTILGILGMISVIVAKSVESEQDKKKKKQQQTQQKILSLESQIKSDNSGELPMTNNNLNINNLSEKPSQKQNLTTRAKNFFSNSGRKLEQQLNDPVPTTSNNVEKEIEKPKKSNFFGRILKGVETAKKELAPELEEASEVA